MGKDVRSQAGRLGAFVTHSRYDSREITAPARAAFLARFERQVDPQGTLEPAERSRRAEYARKAHFQRLAIASAKARRGKGKGRSPVQGTGPEISEETLADASGP